VENTTAATALAPVQNSPALQFGATAWDTDGATSDTQSWRIYNIPADGNTTTSSLVFRQFQTGGAFSTKFAIPSSGFTAGSVTFIGSDGFTLSQDNANLFWDATNDSIFGKTTTGAAANSRGFTSSNRVAAAFGTLGVTGTGDTHVGVYGQSTVTEDVSESGSQAQGVIGRAYVAATAATSAIWSIGGDFLGATTGNKNFTGKIVGVRAGAANQSSGTVDELIDFWSGGASDVGVTTHYGIKLDDFSGATNNWAIKTGAGLVDFGDDVNTAGDFCVLDDCGVTDSGTTCEITEIKGGIITAASCT
jgi:hypothetical protein